MRYPPYYILRGKEPVPVDMMAWARWMETHHGERIVAFTHPVSTVFLSIDHSFGFGTPQLFETMIFGGKHNLWQKRCATWHEAEEQHTEACELAGVRSPFVKLRVVR